MKCSLALDILLEDERKRKDDLEAVTSRGLTISALRIYNYDYVVSIEHEDPIMSIGEGFVRAVKNLNAILIRNQPTDMLWA